MFYDLFKEERIHVVSEIGNDLLLGEVGHMLVYFSDEEYLFRKTAYLAIGKLHKANKSLETNILKSWKSYLE